MASPLKVDLIHQSVASSPGKAAASGGRACDRPPVSDVWGFGTGKGSVRKEGPCMCGARSSCCVNRARAARAAAPAGPCKMGHRNGSIQQRPAAAFPKAYCHSGLHRPRPIIPPIPFGQQKNRPIHHHPIRRGRQRGTCVRRRKKNLTAAIFRATQALAWLFDRSSPINRPTDRSTEGSHVPSHTGARGRGGAEHWKRASRIIGPGRLLRLVRRRRLALVCVDSRCAVEAWHS